MKKSTVRRNNMMNKGSKVKKSTVRKGSKVKKSTMRKVTTVKKNTVMICSTVRRAALKNNCKRTVKASMKKLKSVARMMKKVTRAKSQ